MTGSATEPRLSAAFHDARQARGFASCTMSACVRRHEAQTRPERDHQVAFGRKTVRKMMSRVATATGVGHGSQGEGEQVHSRQQASSAQAKALRVRRGQRLALFHTWPRRCRCRWYAYRHDLHRCVAALVLGRSHAPEREHDRSAQHAVCRRIRSMPPTTTAPVAWRFTPRRHAVPPRRQAVTHPLTSCSCKHGFEPGPQTRTQESPKTRLAGDDK